MTVFQNEKIINLSRPVTKGGMTIEETLQRRASIRKFTPEALSMEEISQLFWAAQGVTREWGARTAPSAGGLFPLEIYVVLKEGVFHYVPRNHQLVRTMEGNMTGPLASAALGQECVRGAPAVFVIAAVYERTARKYGTRAERYVKIEAGHAAQNLLLQAVSLGLGAVPVGAFHDDQVKKTLLLPADQEPLYLLPVGHEK